MILVEKVGFDWLKFYCKNGKNLSAHNIKNFARKFLTVTEKS